MEDKSLPSMMYAINSTRSYYLLLLLDQRCLLGGLYECNIDYKQFEKVRNFAVINDTNYTVVIIQYCLRSLYIPYLMDSAS